MGGVCSKLFCLFCCPPYLPAIVSKVAFSPPVCTYSIIFSENANTEQLVINISEFQVRKEYEKYLHVCTINTSRKYNKIYSRPTISCLYIKTAAWTKTTLLYSHGNAVDIGIIAHTLIELGLELKVNIVTYDYSGYGTSSGQPSEQNLYGDIVAVLEYMTHQLDIAHKHIVLYGQSIGSVPTLFLAIKFSFGGAVLHSALASGFRFLRCGSFCQCCDVLNNAKRAAHVKCPVLLIHGVEDEVTPVEHSYALMKRIPPELLLEPLFIECAGHNNCEVFLVYMNRLQYFIDNELEIIQMNYNESIYQKRN